MSTNRNSLSPDQPAVFSINEKLLDNILFSIYALSIRPVVNIKMNDVLIKNCLYDCGSECSLIDTKTLTFLKKNSSLPLKQVPIKVQANAANKSRMKIISCYEMKCEFEGIDTLEKILVCDEIMDHCIVGIPLIRKLKLGYDPISNTVTKASNSRYIIKNKSRCTVEPYQLAHIKVTLKNDDNDACTNNTVVAYIQPENAPTIASANELIQTDILGISTICVFNAGHQSLTFPKNYIMGSAEIIDPQKIRPLEEVLPSCTINSISTITTKIKTKLDETKLASEADKKWIRENIKLDHLNKADQDLFYNALFKFHYLFSRHKYDIGMVNKELYTHTIELISNERNFAKQWPTTWSHEPYINEAIENWLMAKIIYPLGHQDMGEMNSCIFAVPKKRDPQDKIDNTVSYRVVVDYRFLNKISKCPKFQMPSIPEAFDIIAKNRPKYFSSIDVTSAFQSICLADDEKMKQLTAFTHNHTRYAWNRAPFGIHALPAQFQRLMNTILQPLIKQNLCLPYQDDVLIFSRSKTELVTTLTKCFQIFADAGLKISSRKFLCCVKSLPYLGFEINEDGATVSDDHINSIKLAKEPRSLYEIRAFLGLTSFFRGLCNNYSKMAAPLVAITRKNSKWTPNTPLPSLALKAFYDLKNFLISRPSIGWPNPDPKYKFHLYCDASMHTIDYEEKTKKSKTLKEGSLAYVLCQTTTTGTMVPISYGSRNLRGAERSYSSFLLEEKACEWGIEQCAHYISPPRHFTLWTDCRPLHQVTKKTELRTLSRLQYLMSKYIYDIQYVKGSSMIADYGSRFGYHTATVNGIKMFQSFLPEGDLAKFQNMDPVCKAIIRFLQDNIIPTNPVLKNVVKRLSPQCVITDKNVLLIRSKRDAKYLFFSPASLHAEILAAGHCVDHRGVQGTVDRIMQTFYIPSIYREVEDFIATCTTCARTAKGPKHPHAPLKSVLQSADKIMDKIFLDLFGKLPTVRSFSYILVVVEGVSRHTRFIPIQDKKPETICQALCDQYFNIFSIPSEIISDFGLEFESLLSQKFYDLLKIDKRHSSPYRPSTSGAVESKMKRITHFLKGAFLDLQTEDWPSLLPLLEMCINSAVSRSTGYSPHFLLFNRYPQTSILSGDAPLQHMFGNDFPSILASRIKKIREIAKQHNLEYIEKYKESYDKKVKPLDIQPDTLVWVFKPGHRKLDLVWEGPFICLKKISTYTYLLQNIHTYKTKVVSVHNIKKYTSNPLLSSGQLASHAAAAEKLAQKNISDNKEFYNNEEMNQGESVSNKETSPRIFDDVVLLSDSASASAHRPMLVKNEVDREIVVKKEPLSPNASQLSESSVGDCIPEQQTPTGTKVKSPLQRLGSKIFGGTTQPGFIPTSTEISDFISDSPRLTRQRAQDKQIEVPPIWPLKRK